MPKPFPPPQWIIDDMITLSTVDPQLYPDPNDSQLMWHDHHPVSRAGGVYHRDLLPLFQSARAEQVFLVATLANTAALLRPHLAQARDEGLRCAVLVTDSAAEETSADFTVQKTTDCPVIPFGTIASDLPEEDRLAVLVQLLQNPGVHTLHVIQCPLGWQVISRWARQLKQTGMKLHVTMTEEDTTPLGLTTGSQMTLFPVCAGHLDALYSSSPECTATLQYREGYPSDRILPLPGTHSSPG